MTCRLSVLGFLLALTACSTPRDGHDDAIHLVQRIYTLPDPYFEAFHDPEIRPDFFTARIDALTRKAVACYQEIWQMDHLDFDPIVPGQDYDIDPLQGRIILNEPLPATADDSQLVRAGSFSGNPVFLVARYEYSPGFEDLDDVAMGGRVSHWFGENLKLGLTYSDMEQTGADQKVGGVDLTWRSNGGSYVKIDLARSEGLGVDELASIDGGFSFDTIQQSADPDIEADAGRVEVGLVLGADSKVTAYVQKRERGFSSPGQLAANETEQAGVQLSVPIGEKTQIAVAYDEKDEDQRLRIRKNR